MKKLNTKSYFLYKPGNDEKYILRATTDTPFFHHVAMLSELQAASQSGVFFSTGIPVCILVLKKCKKPDDVLFINAAEHFEKGKRQNQLLPEHIEKIIDTYQHRKEEERYARRVDMEEIKKNDFNLNISRYVSTATKEEDVDLESIHEEITALDRKIREATEKHNAYLKELGLPPLS